METLLGDPIKAREDAKKEAYLKRKGFQVVGSLENPPTNLELIAAVLHPSGFRL